MGKDQIWCSILDVEASIGNTKVFENLNLKLHLGENTVILGPNGSGKSALLKLLDRSIYPAVKPGSKLLVFNTDQINIWNLRTKVGFMNTDIEKRIKNSSRIIDIISSAYFGSNQIRNNQTLTNEQKEKVGYILNELDLLEISNKSFSTLSDGQKRRVLIGRALVHKPQVLVLDEPLTKLDIKSKHTLLRIFNSLCLRGTTLVLATHNVEIISGNTHRLLFMKNGKIIADGHPDKLMNSVQLSSLYDTPINASKSNGFWMISPLMDK